MNIDGKKLWLRVRFVIGWILSGLFIRLPRWYCSNKKSYIQMMWVNYQMPTLEEAKGKRIVFLKNVVKKIIENHYDNRVYPWWTFLPVDLSNTVVFIIALMNLKKVWGYAASFIPSGMETYFYIAFPLLAWIAIEIAQSKWGFDFFWYTHWHTAGVGEGTWYTIDGVATTTISRMLKSALVLGGTWMVFQSIDPRLGTITSETFQFYWPLLVITTCMYVLEGMIFYLSQLLSDVIGWIKMISLSAGMLYAYQAYKIMSCIPITTWKNEWNPAGPGEIVVNTTNWSYLYHICIYYGPRLIIIAIVALIIAYFIVRTHDRWEDIFAILCVTPYITVFLIAGTICYRWYTEIYLPDKLALLATATYEAPMIGVEPVASEAPAMTLIPMATFTLLPEAVTPTWTATTLPVTATPTWTATLLPATATETPMPTNTPSPTPTGEYVQNQNGSPVLVQDMTLPDVSNPWKRIGCNNAVYQIGVVPDAEPVCTNGAAIFKKDGWPLYVLLKVEGSRASFTVTMDGAPEDTVCTLNGEQFGLSGNVKVSTGNTKSRLECDKIGLIAIAW